MTGCNGFDRAAFFKSVRSGILGPTLDADEVAGCEAILVAMEGQPLAYASYVLATAYHETGGDMSPNVESLNYSVKGLLATFGRHRISKGEAQMYGRSDDKAADQQTIGNLIYGGKFGLEQLGNVRHGDGYKYRGRGNDHVTGRANYAKVDAEMGMDGSLLSNPDLLINVNLAAKVIKSGMLSGRYTGKKLSDYLPKHGRARIDQFVPARRIINRLDKAKMVARHALQFQTALIAGDWS